MIPHSYLSNRRSGRNEGPRLFIAGAAVAVLMCSGAAIVAEDGPPVLAPRRTLKGHTSGVWCVALAPRVNLLASGGGNQSTNPKEKTPGELFLWNPLTGDRIANLASQGGRVRALAFSPDGTVLAAAYEGGSAVDRGQTVLWSVPVKTPKGKTPFAARSLAFAKDGRLLALGGIEPPPPQGGLASGGLKVWDVKLGRQTANLVGHRGYVESLAFAPNGRTLVSGSLDGTARIWDARTGKLEATLPEMLGPRPALAISPDGGTLALGTVNTAREGKVVTLWDLKEDKVRIRINVASNVNALTFSHDGKTLAAGTGWVRDGDVVLLDPASGERRAILRGHKDAVKGLAFTADDKTLATGGVDDTVMLWDVPDPTPM